MVVVAALKPIRDKILISTKISIDAIHQRADYRRSLERSLQNLDTDYINGGSTGMALTTCLYSTSCSMRQERPRRRGLSRHISFFRDDSEVTRYIIETTENYGVPVESMLAQYNLLDRSNEEMLSVLPPPKGLERPLWNR